MIETKPTILVIEDEPGAVKLMSIMLGRSGFTTLEAPDAQTAFAILESQTPDLILLDLTLPDKNGIEVCRTLRQQATTGRIPILIMSGLSDDKTVKECTEVGAADFIVKPFRSTELMNKIKAHLPDHQSNCSKEL